MSGRCFLFLVFTFLVIVPASLGDVLVQKSGETIEGVIVKQHDGQLTVRPYLGAAGTITLWQADLAELLPDSRETADFLLLRSEATIRTALGSERFSELLERKIPAFQAKYPSTKYQADLLKIVDQLKADQLRLGAGSVKIAGVWLDHEQVNQEKYQVSAAMLHEAMASAEARGDWTSALNAFQNLRINFPASRAYVEGIDTALRVLPQFRKLAEERLQSCRMDLLRLNLNLLETPAHLRADLVKAERRESEGVAAAIANQRAKGVRWPTLIARSEQDFEQLYDQIAQEIAFLSKLPRDKYRESVDAAIGALQSIADQDATSAEAWLQKSREAWPENEMINRISATIREIRRVPALPSTARTDREQFGPLVIIRNYPRSICAGGAAFCFLLAAIIYLRRAQRSRRRLIG
jgi:hypothetical protein